MVRYHSAVGREMGVRSLGLKTVGFSGPAGCSQDARVHRYKNIKPRKRQGFRWHETMKPGTAGTMDDFCELKREVRN